MINSVTFQKERSQDCQQIETKGNKKWVSYLYRTAQPLTLASFRTWGNSAGAGRIRLTRCKNTAKNEPLQEKYC